jgi:hypothetical protein
MAPGPSLYVLAADVAGAGRGTPEQWLAPARAGLEPSDLAALSPIGTPRGRFTPGFGAFWGWRGVEVGERRA